MWLLLQTEAAPGTPQRSSSEGNCSIAIALPEGQFVIGSSAACSLVLCDGSVSRKHVTIEVRTEGVFFRDEGSTLGTLLNGAPVDDGELVPGDCLTIGTHRLRFVDTLPTMTTKVQTAGPAKDRAKTHTPAVARALIKPRRTTAADTAVSWGSFQTFIDQLGQAASPAELLGRLLTGLASMFEAERGFVLLAERVSGSYHPVASHGLDDVSTLVTVSSTICRHAVKTGKLVYIRDSTADELVTASASLALAQSPRSVLCRALSLQQEVFGVIYLDMPRRQIEPTAEQLSQLTSVTDLASRFLDREAVGQKLLQARSHMLGLQRLVSSGSELVLGTSASSQQLKAAIEAAGPQDVPVLITGETGTGKELVARALHEASPRRDGPFIPVNCGALSPSLVEAELFGAEAGAYTGAKKRRIGLFELAHGGTVLLDEIGTLPLAGQVKLLRVLQQRRLRRLGGTEDVPLDFRLVSATNENLEEEVKNGLFRQDLFYRLHVFPIAVPPLRDRADDVGPLARHFLVELAPRLGKSFTDIAPEGAALLARYRWPGNIRELRNVIERAIILAAGPVLGAADLVRACPQLSSSAAGPVGTDEADYFSRLPVAYEAASRQFELTFFERALRRHAGNISAAARELGLSRHALSRRLQKLGMNT